MAAYIDLQDILCNLWTWLGDQRHIWRSWVMIRWGLGKLLANDLSHGRWLAIWNIDTVGWWTIWLWRKVELSEVIVFVWESCCLCHGPAVWRSTKKESTYITLRSSGLLYTPSLCHTYTHLHWVVRFTYLTYNHCCHTCWSPGSSDVLYRRPHKNLLELFHYFSRMFHASLLVQ
jgi:hypothetical protein